MHQYLIKPGTDNKVLIIFSFSKIPTLKVACKTLLFGSDVAISAPRSNQGIYFPIRAFLIYPQHIFVDWQGSLHTDQIGYIEGIEHNQDTRISFDWLHAT